MKCFVVLIPAMMIGVNSKAQDPHFTQFYSAPLAVNPAYTGVFNGELRAVSNYRRQWVNAASPYNTFSICVDGKIKQQDIEVQNPLNIGLMAMNDQSMKGAFRSNYFSGYVSYHVLLDEDRWHSLGIGLYAAYGKRRIDFSGISFSEQLTGDGFDLSLPNGEAALNNMKPFASVGAGILYLYNNKEEGTFFDFGLSGFHFNKPRQTVVDDANEYLPVRYSAQTSLQRYLQPDLILNLRALYQNQTKVEYVMLGFSIAKLLAPENQHMIGAGCWYRSKDAITPSVLLEYNKLQAAISYDITVSKFMPGTSRTTSWEFSLLYRMGEGSWLK